MGSLIWPPQNRRDGRSPVLGLLPAADTARAFNWERLDSAVGQLDQAIVDATAGGGGVIPDGSITTQKLAPGATVPANVQITNTSGLGLVPATDTLLSEWSVVGQAGRPVLMQIGLSFYIQNTTGGSSNPSDTVATLRQGGAAGSAAGTLVYESPPIVVTQPQNNQTTVALPIVWVWVPAGAGSVRWSLTGRNPSATKNAATLRQVLGTAITFA
jgi:hypothetical protein